MRRCWLDGRARCLYVGTLIALFLFSLVAGNLRGANAAPEEVSALDALLKRLICPCDCDETLSVCNCDTAHRLQDEIRAQLLQEVPTETILQQYTDRYGRQYLIKPITPSARVEKCGECHEDSPEAHEWQRSAHAESLLTLGQHGLSNPNCLSCHSSDSRQQQQSAQVWGRAGVQPASPTSKHDPVACSACHRHGSRYSHYLSLPADKLCQSCHQRTKG